MPMGQRINIRKYHNMKDIFLPPRIQTRLCNRFGHCPRTATEDTAARIEALWLKRNNAPEEELEAIDYAMEKLTYHAVGPLRFLDGHPVPYSCTVQARMSLCDGEVMRDYESIPAIEVLSSIDDWMKECRPNQKLLRTDGAYFFYGEEPKPNIERNQHQ